MESQIWLTRVDKIVTVWIYKFSLLFIEAESSIIKAMEVEVQEGEFDLIQKQLSLLTLS